MSDEPGDCVRRMHDIGIGQQQVVRAQGLGGRNALLERPQLSGPAAVRPFAGDHGHIALDRDRGRARSNGPCIVATVIIDDKDFERARILLLHERPDARARLIQIRCGPDDNGNCRPSIRVPHGLRGVPCVTSPISTAATNQVSPTATQMKPRASFM